jgi:GTP-dependent dephospho-CoA kinase
LGSESIRFSANQLSRFKTPLGHLIPGEPSQTIPKLKEMIERLHPPKIITVGDVVSTEAQVAGIKVNLSIIDGKTMRHGYAPPISKTRVTFQAVNPPGTISQESWRTIKNALLENEATIIVEGEEDLLAVPAVLEAPLKTLIVYGQPSEGIVVVEATSQRKAELEKFLDEIRRQTG